MPDTPLNPDALEGARNMFVFMCADGFTPKDEDLVKGIVSAYLAVAQPEVNSFDPRVLNRKGWTCGCEPGNYDSCWECQSVCKELANFLNRPEVNDA